MTQLLNHESTLLYAAVELSKQKLQLHARSQGEEAGDRADWHDNAAYDEAVRLTALAQRKLLAIQDMLRTAEVIEYPQPDDTTIKLGSLVTACDSYGPMPFVVVGQRTTGQALFKKFWSARPESEDELTVATPESPLGSQALGASVDDLLVYELPNGRKQEILIERIDQVWVARIFDGITKQNLLAESKDIF